MLRPVRRGGLAALLTAAALFGASVATARPYTLDDLLRRETFGAASIAPGARRVVFERHAGADLTPRFEHEFYNGWTTTTLWVADRDGRGPARPLLGPDEGAGHHLGPWSPSGRRLLIFRLRDRLWQAGLVDVDASAVRWLDLAPELELTGRTAQWRSDDELVLQVRPDGRAPLHLRYIWGVTAELTRRWDLAAAGRVPTPTVVGSGAFGDETPAPPLAALVRVDARTGAVTPIMTTRVDDFELSPDGRHLAVLDLDSRLPVDLGEPYRPSEDRWRRRLRLVDLGDGRVTDPCRECDVLMNLLAWSPDGKALLVWTRRGDEPWRDGALTRVDPGTGAARRLPLDGFRAELGSPAFRRLAARAGWLGGAPILYARNAEGRADWLRLGPEGPTPLTRRLGSPPDRIGAIDGDGLLLVSGEAVWRIDVRGRARRLTPPGRRVAPALEDDPLRPVRLRLNAPPRRAWLAVRDESGRIHRVGGGHALGPPGATATTTARLLALTAEARLDAERSPGAVNTLWLTFGSGAGRPVATVNAFHGEVAFAERQAVAHTGPDGEPLTSWLYLPPAGPPARRWPLVILAYPGERNAGPPPVQEPGGEGVPASAQVLAAAGYAVLVPSLPVRPPPAEPASGYAAQVLAVADAALAAEPRLDGGRMALWGHSFGGYGALVAATQTDRFGAVVAAAGVSNLTSAWGEFSPMNRVNPDDGLSIRARAGWVEQSQGAMGAPPWSVPERYARNSPLFAADRIVTPLLLIHGDLDLVPLSQAEILFSALHRQNKDAKLVTYWGEGHVVSTPANLRDMYARVFAFLERTLDGPAALRSATRTGAAPPTPGPSSRPPPP